MTIDQHCSALLLAEMVQWVNMNLRELVDGYEPSDETIDLVKSARIVLLAGIAGAGKDSTKKTLLKSTGYRDIVSHTTRLPRMNDGVMERDGEEYHFISVAEAARMIESKDFVEIKCVHADTVYGTSVAEIRAGFDSGNISLTDVDIQGIDEYKQLSQDVTAVFILPPSYDVWRDRLSKRYESDQEFEQEWPKRLDSAVRELEYALSVPYYHFIINDDLSHTVEVVDSIAHKYRDKFNRKDDEARLAARDLLEAIYTKK